jgi:hypothetical protein
MQLRQQVREQAATPSQRPDEPVSAAAEPAPPPPDPPEPPAFFAPQPPSEPNPVIFVMPPPIPALLPVPGLPEPAASVEGEPAFIEPLASRLASDLITQAPRELTVEELIDLEQQADFFAVLGQDEEAIDLLMGLVRSSGGTSPTPYLKLLEIYRRLDRREAYERIRERFNQRFNGEAPPFEVDFKKGRSLVDYPDVMAQLHAAWGIPQQASAVLNGMLFKRAMPVDPFDLLAYGDLLFLQRIMRDLVDIESGLQGVDLLLPFDEIDAPPTPEPAHSLDLDLDRAPTRH